MKKKWLCAVLMSMMLVMGLGNSLVYAQEEYQVVDLTEEGTITSEDLNVRCGPGKEYDVIGKVFAEDILTISGQADNGWYQIEYEGQTGYVSNQYVVLVEKITEDEPISEPETTDGGETNKPYRSHVNGRYIKAGIVFLVIVVILLAISLTLHSMRSGDDEDEDLYEDESDDDEDEDLYEDESDDEDEPYEDESDDDDEDIELVHLDPVTEKAQPEKKVVILREEDYQLHIDPSFFEEENTIPQPEAIGNTTKLNMAMEKISALEEEIERLKKQ